MNILDFAKDGNADQTYACIDEMYGSVIITDLTYDQILLLQITCEYEEAQLDDQEFCKKVVKHLEFYRDGEWVYIKNK